jgi:tryptophan-rich sensory protein
MDITETASSPARAVPQRDDRNVVAAALLIAGAVAAVALLGSLATSGTVDGAWYETLDKPGWNPPNDVFGPVWTLLYVAIGVAGIQAWRHGAPPAAMAVWGAQLLLNLGWSLLFFGLQRPGWALVEIVVLLAAIVVTAAWFWPIDRLAGALMVPYALWVAFALSLNAAIVGLNA